MQKNYKKITKEQKEQLLLRKKPLGNFWIEEENEIIGISNENGNPIFKVFTNKQECFVWLNGENE